MFPVSVGADGDGTDGYGLVGIFRRLQWWDAYLDVAQANHDCMAARGKGRSTEVVLLGPPPGLLSLANQIHIDINASSQYERDRMSRVWVVMSGILEGGGNP